MEQYRIYSTGNGRVGSTRATNFEHAYKYWDLRPSEVKDVLQFAKKNNFEEWPKYDSNIVF